MRPFVESELIRTPLEEICLQCKRVSKLMMRDELPSFSSRHLIHCTIGLCSA
jgi:hypothetical protein